jgi:hypothetical protein
MSSKKARIFWSALVAISLLSTSCTDAQRCELQTGHSDPAFCYEHAAEINAALSQTAVSSSSGSQSLENGLGSMQGLAEQNQRSAQTLIDQTQQFPRFDPSLHPAYVSPNSWGSGSAPPSPPPGYVSPGPGLGPPYFVPPPVGTNANDWGVAP